MWKAKTDTLGCPLISTHTQWHIHVHILTYKYIRHTYILCVISQHSYAKTVQQEKLHLCFKCFYCIIFLEELWKSHALWNVRMFYHVRSHTTNILVGLPLVELMTKERIQHGPKEKL